LLGLHINPYNFLEKEKIIKMDKKQILRKIGLIFFQVFLVFLVLRILLFIYLIFSPSAFPTLTSQLNFWIIVTFIIWFIIYLPRILSRLFGDRSQFKNLKEKKNIFRKILNYVFQLFLILVLVLFILFYSEIFILNMNYLNYFLIFVIILGIVAIILSDKEDF
jgi:hypothetical protein